MIFSTGCPQSSHSHPTFISQALGRARRERNQPRASQRVPHTGAAERLLGDPQHYPPVLPETTTFLLHLTWRLKAVLLPAGGLIKMMKGDVLPASPAARPPQRHERTPVLQTHRGCCKEQGSTSDQGSAAHLHPKEGRWAWQRCRVPWLQNKPNKPGCFGEIWDLLGFGFVLLYFLPPPHLSSFSRAPEARAQR